jgi:hypothetical protein
MSDLTERANDVDRAVRPHSAWMRIPNSLVLTLALPFTALVVGTQARAADPGYEIWDEAPVELVGIGTEQRVKVEDSDGLDAARRFFADGWERKAAKQMQKASAQIRADAMKLDEKARAPMLEIASRIDATSVDVELGTIDDATLDRKLSSTMRSLAGHHLALARAAFARSEATVAGDHLGKSLDAFERALRWRRASVDPSTEKAVDEAREIENELKTALVLARDVKKALASIGKELDDEIAAANP